MKKVNFWKGLTMAAAVMVSVFATSCSEENMNIEGTDVPPAVVLPDAKASISITVVDLEEGKIVGNVTSIDATAAIGSTITVECPANAGYTTAKAVTVSVPSLEKGQAIVIPVTFYVVTLDSALQELIEEANFSFLVEEDILEITETPISIEEEGWNDNVFINTDEYDWMDADATFNATIGWEYVDEIETSRAAETTIYDLIKNLEPAEITEESVWAISPMTSLFLDAQQVVTYGIVTVTDNKGNVIAEFLGNYYSYTMNANFESIAHDEPGHDEPGHDEPGHGHDHGHGSGNAGGGIGGDNAGE